MFSTSSWPTWCPHVKLDSRQITGFGHILISLKHLQILDWLKVQLGILLFLKTSTHPKGACQEHKARLKGSVWSEYLIGSNSGCFLFQKSGHTFTKLTLWSLGFPQYLMAVSDCMHEPPAAVGPNVPGCRHWEGTELFLDDSENKNKIILGSRQ